MDIEYPPEVAKTTRRRSYCSTSDRTRSYAHLHKPQCRKNADLSCARLEPCRGIGFWLAAEGAVAVAEQIERLRRAGVWRSARRRGQRRRIAPQRTDRR